MLFIQHGKIVFPVYKKLESKVMKKIIKVILLSCMISGFFISYAHAGNIPIKATIHTISNWGGAGDESIWVSMNAAFVNPAGCRNTGWYILANDMSDVSRAMLMGGKLNNSRVGIVVYGGGCTDSGYPMIVNVSLPN